jgi:RNA polymerase sigma factor (sigma-70 family)
MLARDRMAASLPPSDAPAPPNDELDDVTLARAQSGETSAFRSLVERYQGRVQRMLWRMLDPAGRGAQVDDLFQETFLRVFRALPRFEARSARLSTWILTIATRLALNELRRPSSPRLDEALIERVAAPERADAGLDRQAAAAVLRAALASLDPDHRAVLLLREVDGLDYEDIARVLEVNLGTVRSRLSRARARVRAAFGEEEP